MKRLATLALALTTALAFTSTTLITPTAEAKTHARKPASKKKKHKSHATKMHSKKHLAQDEEKLERAPASAGYKRAQLYMMAKHEGTSKKKSKSKKRS